MADLPSSYLIQNCLLFAYRALKNTDRLIQNSLISPYEELFQDIANTLSPSKKLDFSVPNSEVERFYSRRLSENEFLSSVQSKILSKIPACGPGTVVGNGSSGCSGSMSTVVNTFNHFSLLFTVVWELLSRKNSDVCNKIPKLSGKQIWEVFLKLDTGSELRVHVDDIVEVILRIFHANGHTELQDNIKEWFCGEDKIDFWSFYSQLTEKFVGLLQIHVVQELHMSVVSEFLHEGKLEKKGHVVHNWKMRWFVLTASSLSYFESRENLIMKGSVVINANSLVQTMQESKARPHRFRVVCGETKNATEISAPSSKCMHDWIHIIRVAIKMHNIEGRNFLHKYRLALSSLPKHANVKHSMSEDRILNSPREMQSPHKNLSSSKSLPLDSTAPQKTKPLPTLQDTRTEVDQDYEDSIDFNDPPPLPPQRFATADVENVSKPQLSKPQIFDKEAFVEARRNSRISRDRSKRHSSLEPSEVEHIETNSGGLYALISRLPPKKGTEREVSDLLSSTVRAQLNLETTQQIGSWDEEAHKKDEPHKSGYVQLDFHVENGVPRGKIRDDPPSPRPRDHPIDSGKTKFGYSTVVFAKEDDKGFAEKKKQNKLPPQPPPKYEGAGPNLGRNTSDSKISYSDVNFTKPIPLERKMKRISSPDLSQSPVDSGSSNPYENVSFGASANPGPVVPPRRGVALPTIDDDNPPVPVRKS